MSDFDYRNKAALLDTNVVKALLDSDKDAARFAVVIDFLREQQVHPYIIKSITDFEFVGFARSKRAYLELQNWADNFDSLPPHRDPENSDKDDFAVATLLSSMYKCKNPSISPKQISLVDCLYAAHLLRVKGRAFIVTTDLNDYPSFLFDMPKHFAIEENGGQTSFVGIKTYNEQKYKSLQDSFDKSL